MKLKISLLFLLFICSVSLSFLYSQNSGPHKFSQDQCGYCHQVNENGDAGVALADSFSCSTYCHNNLTKDAYMHPVDIQPVKVNIASGFPLSPQGNITCNTCHSVHASYLTPFGSRSYFLRRFERGKMFCDLCHELGTGSPSSGHSEMLSQAHFNSKAFGSGSTFLGIDPVSMNCLSCHDGSLGSSVALNSGLWQHQTSLLTHDEGTHPIGVNYEQARNAKGLKNDLRPIYDVDKRIMFFDGKVGCGSCHNPYSQLDKKLVMPNRKSALCFACHAMDGRR